MTSTKLPGAREASVRPDSRILLRRRFQAFSQQKSPQAFNLFASAWFCDILVIRLHPGGRIINPSLYNPAERRDIVTDGRGYKARTDLTLRQLPPKNDQRRDRW